VSVAAAVDGCLAEVPTAVGCTPNEASGLGMEIADQYLALGDNIDNVQKMFLAWRTTTPRCWAKSR